MGEMKGLRSISCCMTGAPSSLGLTDSSSVLSQPNYRRYRIVPAMEDMRGNQWGGVGYIEANS